MRSTYSHKKKFFWNDRVRKDPKSIIFTNSVTGTVTLVANGLNETTNILERRRIKNIFAEQIVKGDFLSGQVGDIDHEGRFE